MSPLILVTVLAVTSWTLAQVQAQSRNPCINFQCQNGATCTSPLDRPICHCRPGFTGDRCQNTTRVKPGRCALSQNADNGTCVRGCETDFSCPGSQKCCFTFCEKICTSRIIIDPCDGFCQNGGTCIAPADAPICQCPRGFTGRFCEAPVSPNSGTPGSCPVIEQGTVGVCGGRFCQTDSQCQAPQRCCTSACGGKLCTTVSVEVTPQLTCSNVLCNINTVCRMVASCSTCQPQPTCVSSRNIPAGADSLCRQRNFASALLVRGSRVPNSFTPVTCGRSVSGVGTCPRGTECVTDLRQAGVCCYGQQRTPITKPGSCPASQVSTCIWVPSCSSDDQCQGDQKCCASGCGGRRCVSPAVPPRGGESCGNSRCAAGEVCVQRTPCCAPGMSCIQVVLPTCVPRSCESCTCDSTCANIGGRTSCFTSLGPQSCNGTCARGQVCVDNLIRCVRAPCPSTQCVTPL